MTRSSQSTVIAPGDANVLIRILPCGLGRVSGGIACRSLMLHSTRCRRNPSRIRRQVGWIGQQQRWRARGPGAAKRIVRARVRRHGRPAPPGAPGARPEPAPAGRGRRRVAEPHLPGRDRPRQAVGQHAVRAGQRARRLARRPAVHGHRSRRSTTAADDALLADARDRPVAARSRAAGAPHDRASGSVRAWSGSG